MAKGNLVAVPELQADGPAHLMGQQQGFLKLRFLASGATMTQESNRVVRYLLFPGTSLEWDEDGRCSGVIVAENPSQRGGRMFYPVEREDGERCLVDEARIRALHEPANPGEQLAQVDFHDVRQRFGRGGSPMPPDAWGPQAFCARESLLRYRDRIWAMSRGVLGLTGARIEALPHQLQVAHRVLADRQIRFLLADEVGLGKTIEAGLIMQSLLAMRPQLRVLVVAPGALVSQWFLECFIKFGGRRFTMLDGERIQAHRGNPWDDQFIIISSHALEMLSGKERIRFASTRWDLLIVDECHRMQPGGRLYRQVSTLSKRVPHVLLLSATPGRQHPDAYLALLTLLQPDVYDPEDVAGFEAKLQAHDQVLDLCERTYACERDAWAAVAADWQQTLGADETVEELLRALQQSDDADAFTVARTRLLAYVREHYQLDHRVISNRRQVLARLSEATGIKGLSLGSRAVEWIRYQVDAAEMAVREAMRHYRAAVLQGHDSEALPPRVAHWLLQVELACWTHPRILDRLLAMRAAVLEEPEEYADYRNAADPNEGLTQVLRTDFSESESSTHIAISAASHPGGTREMTALEALRSAVSSWSPKHVARVKAMVDRIKTFWKLHPQEKLLIFVGHGTVVTQIADMLIESLGDCVETFGAHQDALEREESARRFRELDQISIMVSDPLGGEGRNFQFVSVVVHYDLPWSIAAVEQRIGRVDRLGRDGEVPSWVCVPDDAHGMDAAWAAILHEAIDVFQQSSSGLEFVAGRIEEAALRAALEGGADGLREQLPGFVALVAEERAARDEREDRLLAQQEQDFLAMAELAGKVDALDAPVRAVCNWLRGLGGQVRRDEEGARPFKLRSRHADDFQEGVFKRTLALQHERYAYFAQGHDLIDRLIDDAGAANWCRANAWRRKPDRGVQRWEGIRVSYDWQLDFAPLMTAKLPLETLRRLFRVVSPERSLACFRFDPDAGIVLEEDEDVLALVRPDFGDCMDDATLSPRTSREFWMRPVLSEKADQVYAWQQQVLAATTVAEQHGAVRWSAISGGFRRKLEQALHADLAVLRGQLASFSRRLGDAHPDTRRLHDELEADEATCAALNACLAGASYRLSGMSYLVVA